MVPLGSPEGARYGPRAKPWDPEQRKQMKAPKGRKVASNYDPSGLLGWGRARVPRASPWAINRRFAAPARQNTEPISEPFPQSLDNKSWMALRMDRISAVSGLSSTKGMSSGPDDEIEHRVLRRRLAIPVPCGLGFGAGIKQAVLVPSQGYFLRVCLIFLASDGVLRGLWARTVPRFGHTASSVAESPTAGKTISFPPIIFNCSFTFRSAPP